MSFPTTGLLDDFARADANPIDGSWAAAFNPVRRLRIISGLVTSIDANLGREYWNAGTFGADSEAWCAVTTKPGLGNSIRLILRAKDVGSGTTVDCYQLRYEDVAGTDEWHIERVKDGAATGLVGPISFGMSDGDLMGFEVIGQTLTAYQKLGLAAWDVVPGCTFLDDSHADRLTAAGYIGMGCQQTTGRLNDFGGGTVVGGGGGGTGPKPGTLGQMDHGR